MRKNLLSKFVLLATVLLMGTTGALAEEEQEVFYTLDGTNKEAGGNSNYAQAGSDVVEDDMHWSVTANATTAPWRVGGKNLTNVNREIYSKTTMGSAISKIDLAVGDITLTVHSITLIVASDADFKTELDKIEKTTISANSTLTFTPTNGSEWAKSAFYKFVINVTAGSSNSYIQFKSANFFKYKFSPSIVDPELTVTETVSMTAGMEKPISNYYTTNSDGVVSFESDDASVANVVEGVLKAYKAGEAKITISIATSQNYKSASGEITVTVTENQAIAPEGPAAGGSYELVTDASTLAAGDKLIIVSGTNGTLAAMSTTQNDNNRAAASVTALNDVISKIGNDVQVITLEGESGAWYLKVGDDKYLYAASSTKNYLRTTKKATAGDNGKAIITIKGTATASITFQGTYTRNNLRYNSDGQGLFSCYDSSNSTMAFPYLFRYIESTAESFDITIGATGWKTFVPASNVRVPNTLTAYTVAVSNGKAELTPVEEVPAGAAVLLNGEAGDHTMTILKTEVAALAGNELQVSDADTGNGVFVLANKENGVGFYKWTGGKLGAGRVYLNVPSTSRSFISWGEATGISNLTEQKTAETFYDLQGRRVAHPQKGLYIMDGRKVVVK